MNVLRFLDSIGKWLVNLIVNIINISRTFISDFLNKYWLDGIVIIGILFAMLILFVICMFIIDSCTGKSNDYDPDFPL